MTDIDCIEKIRTFQQLTDNYNEDEAFNYLLESNWNVNLAAQNYLKTKKKKTEFKGNDYVEIPPNDSSPHDQLLDNHYERASVRGNIRNSNSTTTEGNNEGYFSYYVGRPLGYLKSLFCSKCNHFNNIY